MKKILSIFVTLAMALAANIALVVDSSEAVPAFARQMQMSCKGCHFQHFPKLNAMGRAFKANGYTDVAVETIDGDWGTSIPINLNMTWITKIQYRKRVAMNASTQAIREERGRLMIVDEGVFFTGGRVSEHIGAAIEIAGGNWANGTVVFGTDLETIDTHAGLTLWSTDAAGPFWGKDLFNTGLARGARGWENRGQTQAANVIYDANSGVTAYLVHDWFFAAFGGFTQGLGGVDVGADLSWVYRLAITPPQIWGFDTMVGVYGIFGGTSYGGTAAGGVAGARIDVNQNVHGVDFQAQGNLTEGITLEILGNIMYNSGNVNDGRNYLGADYFRAQFGIDVGLLDDRLIGKFNYFHSSTDLPNAFLAGAALAAANQSEGVDIISLGLYWNIRENVSLRPEISWVVGSGSNAVEPNAGMVRNGQAWDTAATIMLFYAF